MIIHIWVSRGKIPSLIYLLIIAFCCFQSREAYSQTDTTGIRHKVQLSDITVTAKSVCRNNSYTYLPNAAKNIITPLGGTDIMRYIGTLPGVSQGMEGGMGFYVRGGNNGNNRIELDGVPIYGSTHLFGLFSTFSPDIIQSTTFRTGGIPVSSGDMLASLTEIKTLSPDTVKFSGKYSLSPFMTSASINLPINKKIGILSTGRISLLWPEYLLIKSIAKTETDFNPQIADFYFKITDNINDNHRLSASTYVSTDYFLFAVSNLKMIMNWGNLNGRIGWDWKMNEKMQLQTFFYYNHFYSGQKQTYFKDELRTDLTSNLLVQSALTEEVLQSSLRFKINNINIHTGLSIKNQHFEPLTQETLTSKQNDISVFNDNLSTQSITTFGEINFKKSQLNATFGLRENLYLIGPKIKLLTDIRFNSTYTLKNNIGFEVSYDLLTQTHHSLEGLPVGWSLDLIVPANKDFKPEVSNQLYFGSFWSNNTYMISGGFYYKQMNNLVSYINPINAFSAQNASWKDEVTSGTGKSYGMELRVTRKSNRLNSELSYTLSNTTRQFNLINAGKTFPFKFDRRHILNLNNQVVTKKSKTREQSFNFSLSYYTGNKATIPIGEYKGITPPYWTIFHNSPINSVQNEMCYYRQVMSEENNYTMPYYFRVDIGYSFTKTNKHSTSELTLGLYNILNRQNPYLIFYQDNSWKQLSILPIIPSIEWTIGF